VAEYERMAATRIVREAEAILDDPEMEWYDLEDVVAKWNVEKLVKARKARGLTQAQLGKRVGMPQSQISRLERNPDASSLRLIKKIAKALKVPPGDLV
jgi:DNA-binding XRE family transcriptional regulator